MKRPRDGGGEPPAAGRGVGLDAVGELFPPAPALVPVAADPPPEAVTAVEAAAKPAGVVRALQTALHELRTEREAHEATRGELAQVRGEREGMQSDLARARHRR